MSRTIRTSVREDEWFRDAALQRVLTLLNREQGEARVVGGAVRNALLGMAVSDIDIATTLLPEEVIARAQAGSIKVVPTGVDHGTVTLVLAGKPYEVTTLRADVETDGRRAKVAFGTDWRVDAERRDLTINALYVGPDGNVVDLVGGLKDIDAGVVRFIGDPAERIAEDYLRVLRFFRFFAWYGSGRPDAEALKACAAAREKLATLSVERVWMETKKLLAATDPGRALLWMRQTGILTEVLPETEKWGIDAVPGLIKTEQAFRWSPDPMLRLAAVIPPDAERIAAMAKRLKMSRAEAARLIAWAQAPTVPYDMKDTVFDRLLYRNDATAVLDRLKLQLASARARAISDTKAMVEAAGFSRLVERAQKWRQPEFPLSGRDLMRHGLKEGPEVGEARRRLEDLWIESNFRLDRDALLGRVAEVTGSEAQETPSSTTRQPSSSGSSLGSATPSPDAAPVDGRDKPDHDGGEGGEHGRAKPGQNAGPAPDRTTVGPGTDALSNDPVSGRKPSPAAPQPSSPAIRQPSSSGSSRGSATPSPDAAPVDGRDKPDHDGDV